MIKLLCYDGTKIKKYIETATEARLFCNFTKLFTSKFKHERRQKDKQDKPPFEQKGTGIVQRKSSKLQKNVSYDKGCCQSI
jgi:hypothetical protein